MHEQIIIKHVQRLDLIIDQMYYPPHQVYTDALYFK